MRSYYRRVKKLIESKTCVPFELKSLKSSRRLRGFAQSKRYAKLLLMLTIGTQRVWSAQVLLRFLSCETRRNALQAHQPVRFDAYKYLEYADTCTPL